MWDQRGGHENTCRRDDSPRTLAPPTPPPEIADRYPGKAHRKALTLDTALATDARWGVKGTATNLPETPCVCDRWRWSESRFHNVCFSKSWLLGQVAAPADMARRVRYRGATAAWQPWRRRGSAGHARRTPPRLRSNAVLRDTQVAHPTPQITQSLPTWPFSLADNCPTPSKFNLIVYCHVLEILFSSIFANSSFCGG